MSHFRSFVQFLNSAEVQALAMAITLLQLAVAAVMVTALWLINRRIKYIERMHQEEAFSLASRQKLAILEYTCVDGKRNMGIVTLPSIPISEALAHNPRLLELLQAAMERPNEGEVIDMGRERKALLLAFKPLVSAAIAASPGLLADLALNRSSRYYDSKFEGVCLAARRDSWVEKDGTTRHGGFRVFAFPYALYEDAREKGHQWAKDLRALPGHERQMDRPDHIRYIAQTTAPEDTEEDHTTMVVFLMRLP